MRLYTPLSFVILISMVPTTIDDTPDEAIEKAAALAIEESKIVTTRICNATESAVFKTVAFKRAGNGSNVQISIGNTIHVNRAS